MVVRVNAAHMWKPSVLNRRHRQRHSEPSKFRDLTQRGRSTGHTRELGRGQILIPRPVITRALALAFAWRFREATQPPTRHHPTALALQRLLSIAGASSSTGSSSGFFILSVPFGTLHVSTAATKYLAWRPPRSYAGFKGPAVSIDSTPAIGSLTVQCGGHCWELSWHTRQSLLYGTCRNSRCSDHVMDRLITAGRSKPMRPLTSIRGPPDNWAELATFSPPFCLLTKPLTQISRFPPKVVGFEDRPPSWLWLKVVSTKPNSLAMSFHCVVSHQVTTSGMKSRGEAGCSNPKITSAVIFRALLMYVVIM